MADETADLAVPQFDIFGAEHEPEPPRPAYCRPSGKFEQPRLFQPQYEGQLAMAGGDYPEDGADAPER